MARTPRRREPRPRSERPRPRAVRQAAGHRARTGTGALPRAPRLPVRHLWPVPWQELPLLVPRMPPTALCPPRRARAGLRRLSHPRDRAARRPAVHAVHAPRPLVRDRALGRVGAVAGPALGLRPHERTDQQKPEDRMSMAWFRSYHGAPFDAKHVTVAKRSDTQPGVSCAVWWALLDYASQHEDRGSVAGFDCEIAADFFGWGVETVARVVQVMGEVGLISDHRIANWDKRQVQRERPEDHSSERVRRYREKHVTPRNAMKRHEPLMKRSVTQTPKNRSSDVAETVATAAAQATATQDDSACNATKRHETPRVDKRRVDKELLQKPVRERPER